MNVFKNTVADADGCGVVNVKEGERQNRVHFGDLLFTQSSETLEEVGLTSVWLHDRAPLLNSFCFGFRFNMIDIINPRFIAYGMRTPSARKRITREGQGATRYNLSPNRLKKVSVRYPYRKEQDKIAGFLLLLETRIEKQHEVVNTLKKYKRGLNHKILSGIDEQYNCELGTICSIVSGGTPSTLHPEYWKGTVEWFTPSEIGKVKYVLSSLRKISQIGLSNSSAKLLPANAVLVTTRATLGEMSIARSECSTNQGIQSLIADSEKVLPEYLYYLQALIKPWCEKYASGNTFREISRGSLSKCVVPIPDLDKQTKIANLLSKIDDLISAQEQIKDATNRLKESLLQQLFI